MKDLKEKLEKEGIEVKWELFLDGGYEDDLYLNVNNKIDIFEGAYQKWDTSIEEDNYKEKSFMNDEDLISYIKDES
jgi:hypothetical protein